MGGLCDGVLWVLSPPHPLLSSPVLLPQSIKNLILHSEATFEGHGVRDKRQQLLDLKEPNTTWEEMGGTFPSTSVSRTHPHQCCTLRGASLGDQEQSEDKEVSPSGLALRTGAVSRSNVLSPVPWEMFASEVLRDPNETKQLHTVIMGLSLAVLAHVEGWTYSRGLTLSLPCRKGSGGSA